MGSKIHLKYNLNVKSLSKNSHFEFFVDKGIDDKGTRTRVSPIKTLMDATRKDMLDFELTENMILIGLK